MYIDKILWYKEYLFNAVLYSIPKHPETYGKGKLYNISEVITSSVTLYIEHPVHLTFRVEICKSFENRNI